ncbi:MAG: YfhO family protein [Candidatus Tectomicrobia bacterium]|nr:YfhO family protein [Candidatus Tectomicrobia bacterium]
MLYSTQFRPTLQALLLYLVVVLLLFWKVLFSGEMLVGRDSFVIFYPWRHFLLESYRQGILPLWNPYAYGGQPFLANQHSGVLYPLNLLLFLGPLWYSMALSAVFHIFLAGCFMYAFLRAAGSSQGAALFGGLVYLGSGWFVKHLEVFPHVSTVAWTPLVFFCFELARRQPCRLRGNPYLYLGGAVSGLQVLSGHPLFLYTQLGLLAYALCRAASPDARHGRQPWHAPLLLFLAMNLLSGLLAAAQLLPALEYSRLSNRAAADYGYVTQLSLPPRQLLTLVAPYLFGDPAKNTYWGEGFFWITCLYVGVVPLLLAVLGSLLQHRHVLARFATILASASLLLTLGNHTPAYRLIFALPVFSRLRYPTMFILLSTFALSILAARGFEAFGRQQLGQRLKWGAGAGVILLLAFFTFLLVAQKYNDWLLALSLPLLALPGVRSLLSFANEVGFHTAATDLWTPLVFLTLTLLILLLWNRLGKRGPFAVRLATVLLFLSVAADLLIFGMKLTPLTDARLASSSTATIDLLQQEREPFRLWTYHRTRQDTRKFYNYVFHHRGYEKHDLETMLRVKDHLPYNVPMLYRFSSVIGYDSLKINRFRTFGVSAENEFAHGTHRLLDLLNTRFVLADEALFLPGLERIRDGEMKVYRNVDALPRAFLVSRIIVEPREKAIFNLLRSPSFDPRSSVLFEAPPPAEEVLQPAQPQSATAGSAAAGEGRHERLASARFLPTSRGDEAEGAVGTAQISRFEPNRLVVEVEARQPAYLVLSEINYPGWRARVDGTSARVHTANYVLRAVYVPAGRHRVEWFFSPWSVRVGAVISLLTFVGLACVGVAATRAAWRRRHRAVPHESLRD